MKTNVYETAIQLQENFSNSTFTFVGRKVDNRTFLFSYAVFSYNQMVAYYNEKGGWIFPELTRVSNTTNKHIAMIKRAIGEM